MKTLLISICSLFFSIALLGQTAGTLLNTEESLQGYTFFSPFSSNRAFIVDNCGRLINEWDRGSRPGLAAYFLENGNLFRTYKPNPVGPFTSASNSGGVEMVDWDNNVVWSYQVNTSETLSHHDAIYLPNGNALMLTWLLIYEDELIDLGRDPNEIASQGFMWSERIIEVEPVGSSGGNIVWEWGIKDHYIQDFDSTKLNYGVVSEHPERFDINLPELNSSNSNSSRDWNHFNAIDYNPELDQILISVRNSDEIWIIDHSTTTAEAASSSGGAYGKGGDILYRWGNASAYQRAPVSDQKLFGQHGVNWIPPGYPDAGKIMVFNNGNGRPGPDYSTAEIITPPQDSIGGYILPDNAPFGPDTSEIIYGNLPGEDYYSAYLSNAQRLINGNTLINSGSPGRIFEVNSDRDIVWAYEVPLNGDSPATQGQNVSNNGNFRAYRYGPDYPGFDGVDLTPGLTIEFGTDTADCEIFVVTDLKKQPKSDVQIFHAAANNQLVVQDPAGELLEMDLISLSGRTWNLGYELGQTLVALPELPSGFYIIRSQIANGQLLSQKIVVP